MEPDVHQERMDVVVSVERVGGAAIAAPEGEIDALTGPSLREQLLAALDDRPSLLVVDLSRASFLDSTGLGVLVLTARRARLIRCAFCLASPTPLIAKVLALTALDRAWSVYPSAAEALEAHSD